MEMENNIIFYTYGSTLELNGQQFDAGKLTEELLNLSPDDYPVPCTNGWRISPSWSRPMPRVSSYLYGGN